ncbi:hypothetical protein I7I53_09632 [Histoplasma capsulatum var. duboisii H88]|uniref:Uncharacterized protein n=1 Tax=Ajellomyces capsulatus (strain H88) TaxID=544711 RepID=A0A8A1L942_AJEC8|nr:hypothetical protein I7I53_09632 [Histoplasma capsulatum var. duboisii H88]
MTQYQDSFKNPTVHGIHTHLNDRSRESVHSLVVFHIPSLFYHISIIKRISKFLYFTNQSAR